MCKRNKTASVISNENYQSLQHPLVVLKNVCNEQCIFYIRYGLPIGKFSKCITIYDRFNITWCTFKLCSQSETMYIERIIYKTWHRRVTTVNNKPVICKWFYGGVRSCQTRHDHFGKSGKKRATSRNTKRHLTRGDRTITFYVSISRF